MPEVSRSGSPVGGITQQGKMCGHAWKGEGEMIDVENLQLRIDGREILRGVRMHLEPGDIYGLLGPNGAGKSTTIFALLGLRRRSGGQVRVQGADPDDKGVEIRRTIGVMPESAGFYEWMTSEAYLQWYATLYGQPIDDKDLHGLLRTVGLAAVRNRPIGSYSRPGRWCTTPPC
jgi:ABC-2 type transport system ATP-binding protein